MIRNSYILIICLLLLSLSGNGQSETEPPKEFFIYGRFIEGRPVIKILPLDKSTWFLGMKNGYTVSVSQFQNGTFSDFEVLERNLKPAPETEFAATDAPAGYAVAMRKTIYEETFVPPGKSFDDLAAADKNMNRLFLSYILLSSYDQGLSAKSGLQLELPSDISERFRIKVEINSENRSGVQEMRLSLFYSEATAPDPEVIAGDRSATLQWNHANYKTIFAAYLVERSTDGLHFDPIGSPRVFNKSSASGKMGLMVAEDSLPKNYTRFWYRIRGYDAFGILSEPGKVVSVSGKDLTPPAAPQRVQVNQLTRDKISISWTHDPAVDLEGFQVIAAESEKGQYSRLHQKLLPPDQHDFVFTFQESPLLYYRVLAVDTAHNAAASDLGYLVVYDTIPPSVPHHILATADTNNVVTLRWNRSPESDTKGYRISKAYHPTNGFVPITPIPVSDTIYTDTIAMNRLEKNVYYRVSSLDAHYNNSKPSPPVAAKLIDRIPPTAPLLTLAEKTEDEKVHLTWNPSSSEDVMSYKVLRVLANDSGFVEIADLPSVRTEYSDLKATDLNVGYVEYYVTAADSAGNVSKRSNGKRILFQSAKNTSDIAIRATEVQNDKIIIKWDRPFSDTGHILVYRAEKDGVFELIDRVVNAVSYSDRKVKEGKEYAYKIGVLTSSGSRSKLSEEVWVRFK